MVNLEPAHIEKFGLVIFLICLTQFVVIELRDAGLGANLIMMFVLFAGVLMFVFPGEIIKKLGGTLKDEDEKKVLQQQTLHVEPPSVPSVREEVRGGEVGKDMPSVPEAKPPTI